MQRVGFLWQSEKNKLQLLELMGNRTAGKKQGWKASFTTNVCVVLLGGLKVCIYIVVKNQMNQIIILLLLLLYFAKYKHGY
jgi:hypothetical protein